MLHRRASAWLADPGWIEEAVQHALAGGDDLAAAHLVAQQRHDLLNREEWRTLERWLSMLPEVLVQRHPPLLMTKAWVLNLQFRLAATVPLLQAAATHLHDYTPDDAEAQQLSGEMQMLWSQILYWQNAGQQSLAAAQQALERLPASFLYARSSAFFYLGLATQMVGQTALAVHTLREALESQQAQPSTFVSRMFFALTFVHYLGGELLSMHQMAQDLLQVATQGDLALTRGWAHYLLGIVHYEWNELEIAAQHFAALVALRDRIHVLTIHHGWLGLAWTQQAQGRFDQVQQQVDELLHFHREMNHLSFLPITHSFQARLALQQGDGTAAWRWAQAANLRPPQEPLALFEISQITRAKVMVSRIPATGGADALAELAQLRQVAESTHNTPRQIELLALHALAEATQGERELALATLQRAVMLAKAGGFIRTFVDLGPPLAGLLYELAARGVEAEYLGHVLAAFPPTAGAADPAQRIRRAAQEHLIEPLTERESEVLLHLSQKRSNKAIARALNISALTVKKHTIHLYQKLGVHSRQQAVARARALGILPLDSA
jgi:LuxR family maltose regulon positive regulatory protein